MSTTATSKVFNIINSAGIEPASQLELISLVFHSLLISDYDFITVEELPNSVPGFAPSVKEISNSALVVPRWNSDESSVTFQYKNKAKKGKRFALNVTLLSDMVFVNLSQKDGESYGMEIILHDYILSDPKNGSNTSSIVPSTITIPILKASLQIEKFEEMLQQFRSKVLDLFFPPKPANELINERSYFVSPSNNSFLPGHNPYHPPIVPPIGNDDLNPFPSLVGPMPLGSTPFAPSFGGNLVGPNHPIFAPQRSSDPFHNDDFTPPFMPGGGGSAFPHPRFDPISPIPGPNQEPDFGFGLGGRSRNGGRGNARRFPGEPNPDHLKPPGW